MPNSIAKMTTFLRQYSLSMVLIPWLIYALYLTLMASPRYESTSQVIVKSTDGGSSFDPTSLLASAAAVTGGSASNDSLLVLAFIKSNDMLLFLEQNLQLSAHYTDTNIDFFSRLASNHTREEFIEYYLDRVSVEVDSASSVITIRSQAFDPAFAQQINAHIIQRAEDFINSINNNLAKSKLTFANGEHAIVEQKLQQAKMDLLAFQGKYNVLDPTAEGMASQQIAFSLQATLAQKRAELSTLSSMMSDSAPEIINIRRQINALEQQVANQKSAVVSGMGNSDGLSVSQLMAQYSNLQVQVELALQAYASSLISLENARVEAYQQIQHLVKVSSPQEPEESAYPDITYNLILFAIALLMGFAVIRIIIATIKEL